MTTEPEYGNDVACSNCGDEWAKTYTDGLCEECCGACLDTQTCANCGTTDPARDIQSGLCAACFAAMPAGEWCSTPWPVGVTA
jgi:hypothetical protein